MRPSESRVRGPLDLRVMKKTILSLCIATSVGCSTYRVSPLTKLDIPKEVNAPYQFEKTSNLGEGKHCFEPYLYVLTLGIIPAHCVDRYSVYNDTQQVGQIKVTRMMGWIPLFMSIFPGWQYGDDIILDIEFNKLIDKKTS